MIKVVRDFLIKPLALSRTNRGGAAPFFYDLHFFCFALLLSPSMLAQMEQKGQPHERVTLHYCKMHDSMHCFLTWRFLTKGRLQQG